MCIDTTIQELLPAYGKQTLDRADTIRVEAHLASCEDCRSELALLRMLAEEDVPDPGPAFWAAMPARVYREVQEQRSRKKSFGLAWVLDRMILPNWAWAAAAVSIIVVVSWLIVPHPAVDVARTNLWENGTANEYDLSMEPMDVTELSAAELAAATSWAQNAFAPIREEIGEDSPAGTERDISEGLSELSPQELDRVHELLKKKEQDARNKLRKSPRKDNVLG